MKRLRKARPSARKDTTPASRLPVALRVVLRRQDATPWPSGPLTFVPSIAAAQAMFRGRWLRRHGSPVPTRRPSIRLAASPVRALLLRRVRSRRRLRRPSRRPRRSLPLLFVYDDRDGRRVVREDGVDLREVVQLAAEGIRPVRRGDDVPARQRRGRGVRAGYGAISAQRSIAWPLYEKDVIVSVSRSQVSLTCPMIENRPPSAPTGPNGP